MPRLTKSKQSEVVTPTKKKLVMIPKALKKSSTLDCRKSDYQKQKTGKSNKTDHSE